LILQAHYTYSKDHLISIFVPLLILALISINQIFFNLNDLMVHPIIHYFLFLVNYLIILKVNQSLSLALTEKIFALIAINFNHLFNSLYFIF